MCDIPLDLQRKFEQRWAARFFPPVAPKQEPEGQEISTSLPPPPKRKKPAGLGPVPTA
jgi:hypothetical protein